MDYIESGMCLGPETVFKDIVFTTVSYKKVYKTSYHTTEHWYEWELV